MAPVRSTTPVVTEVGTARRSRRSLIGVGLVVLSVLAVIGVTRYSDEPDRAPAAAPAPSPLVVGDGRTVTLINRGGSATDAMLARVAADIGPATSAVEAFWGTDWSHQIVIVATGTPGEFNTEAGAEPRGDTAAVAVAGQVDPARGIAIGQRIVLAPGAADMNPAALRIVVTHELFHYAARADTAADAPRWLMEGVADYVARPAPAPGEFREVGTALPADADFTGSPERLSAAYDRAWLFARFVAERNGPPALRQLYLRVCGNDHLDVPTALQQVLGAGPDELLAQWRGWLARTAPAVK